MFLFFVFFINVPNNIPAQQGSGSVILKSSTIAFHFKPYTCCIFEMPFSDQ